MSLAPELQAAKGDVGMVRGQLADAREEAAKTAAEDGRLGTELESTRAELAEARTVAETVTAAPDEAAMVVSTGTPSGPGPVSRRLTLRGSRPRPRGSPAARRRSPGNSLRSCR